MAAPDSQPLSFPYAFTPQAPLHLYIHGGTATQWAAVHEQYMTELTAHGGDPQAVVVDTTPTTAHVAIRITNTLCPHNDIVQASRFCQVNRQRWLSIGILPETVAPITDQHVAPISPNDILVLWAPNPAEPKCATRREVLMDTIAKQATESLQAILSAYQRVHHLRIGNLAKRLQVMPRVVRDALHGTPVGSLYQTKILVALSELLDDLPAGAELESVLAWRERQKSMPQRMATASELGQTQESTWVTADGLAEAASRGKAVVIAAGRLQDGTRIFRLE